MLAVLSFHLMNECLLSIVFSMVGYNFLVDINLCDKQKKVGCIPLKFRVDTDFNTHAQTNIYRVCVCVLPKCYQNKIKPLATYSLKLSKEHVRVCAYSVMLHS